MRPLLAAVAFGQPTWLWALPVVALVVIVDTWLWQRVSGRLGVGPWSRLRAASIRLVLLCCCVLALSEPRWFTERPVAHVIFTVDRSASVPDAQQRAALERVEQLRAGLPAGARTGLVTFARTPTVDVFPGHPLSPHASDARPRDEATALARALELSLGLVPEGDEGTVVLLSDGRGTDGSDALDEAVNRARARGIEVHTLALHPDRDDPAVVDVSVDRATFRPGERVEGVAVLDGGAEDGRGKLVVKMGGTSVHEQNVSLPAGQRLELAFEFALDHETTAGPLPLEVTYEASGGDAHSANNRLAITAVVGAPPQVRIFTPSLEDAKALARALVAEQMQVEVVKLDALERRHFDLRDTDLVVLANTPSALADTEGLPSELIDNLVRYVDAGGGLIVTGGPRALDLGAMGHTELAQVLPVRLDNVDSELEAAATMLIILDRSGSMSAMAEGPLGPSRTQTKMELADEGAVASIRLLRPFDHVGVMSVTEWVRWDVPLQPVRDIAAIEKKLMAIRADGGGIFVYTALEEAQKTMQRAQTPLRHIIVFSDAADAEEKIRGIPFGTGPGPTAIDLAINMRKNGISTSVIAIGDESDMDTGFLEELARAGGGRFYLTHDARKLRALFVEETERFVETSMREEPFRVRRKRPHPALRGIEYNRSPELLGFQALDPQPSADVLLAGPEDQPILVSWRYGLGNVLVWTSDVSPRWAAKWLAWHGFVRHWAQLARYALREDAGKETALEVEHRESQSIIRVARRSSEGLALDDHGLRLRVESSAVPGKESTGTNVRELPLVSLEPGLWQAELATQPGAIYQTEVIDGEGTVLANQSFAAPLSAERRHRTADVDRLREIAERTGGRYEPDHIEPRLHASATAHMRRLWPWLAVLAIVLLPVDAWTRRSRRET